MRWNLVWAIVIRHMYNFKHTLDRSTDVFFWPAMDIILWGFTTLYISQEVTGLPYIITTVLSGLILWMTVWRGQYEITVNLLEEMWNQNMINIFASPIKLKEWIAGVFLLGIIKMFFTLTFATLVAVIVYKAQIFSLGFYLIPFLGNLLLTGWGFGILVAAVIIRYGTKIQTLAWSGVSLISPFSGVFYPISVLPDWAQKISAFLPTSYIFEGMRIIILKGTLPLDYLLKAFLLNIFILSFGLIFFNYMFKKSKEDGLSRLE